MRVDQLTVHPNDFLLKWQRNLQIVDCMFSVWNVLLLVRNLPVEKDRYFVNITIIHNFVANDVLGIQVSGSFIYISFLWKITSLLKVSWLTILRVLIKITQRHWLKYCENVLDCLNIVTNFKLFCAWLEF